MSGLEALAALGLACNVMQIIDFTHETISLCKKVYNGLSPDPNLATSVSQLDAFLKELDARLKNTPDILDPSQKALVAVAKSTATVVNDIRVEADKIFGNVNASKGNVIAAVAKTTKYVLSRRKIERLEKKVFDNRQILEVRFLLSIRSVFYFSVLQVLRYAKNILNQSAFP